MKAKIYKLLDYFVKQINTEGMNSGLCNNVIRKVKDYIDLAEIELSGRELDTIAEIRHNEPLRMLLALAGVYVPLTIENDTIRFLYENNKELYRNNKKISLTCMLLELQYMLDRTYFFAEMYGIYRQVYTVTELKELQKEINEKWKSKI